MLFYDGHVSHFDDRASDIICRHNIQSFILKAGDFAHDQPNDNGPNTKLNNLYGNKVMNWMRYHGTLKFKRYHMNSVLVETWEDLKLSSATITHKAFKKTHLLPLYPPDIETNHQYCLAGTKQSNREKADEIWSIAKAIIAPIDKEEVVTNNPKVILL